jgi:hypothetical protein
MDFSFVVCAGPNTEDNLNKMIDSIEAQHMPRYEILIIGEPKVKRDNTFCVEFNYNGRDRWTSRKHNVGCKLALFDNVVFLHDYELPHDGWYSAWVAFGDNWEVALNPIQTLEGYRHSDWCVLPHDYWAACPELQGNWDVSLPYNIRGVNAVMHVSGNYYLSKRDFFLKYQYNEDLNWWDGEDVEWVRRIRPVTEIQFNENAAIRLIKPNKWAPGELLPERLNRIVEHFGLSPYYV